MTNTDDANQKAKAGERLTELKDKTGEVLEDLKEKGQDFLGRHENQIDSVIEKVAGFVDDQTKRKYHDKIETVTEKAKVAVEKLAGGASAAGTATTAEDVESPLAGQTGTTVSGSTPTSMAAPEAAAGAAGAAEATSAPASGATSAPASAAPEAAGAAGAMSTPAATPSATPTPTAAPTPAPPPSTTPSGAPNDVTSSGVELVGEPPAATPVEDDRPGPA